MLAYLPLVSPVATLVVVVLGVFFSNRHVDVRIGDLRSYMDARFNAVDTRFNAGGRFTVQHDGPAFQDACAGSKRSWTPA